MNTLEAKINAIDKKLEKNRDELWNVTEERRKLEAEIIELREKLFDVTYGNGKGE